MLWPLVFALVFIGVVAVVLRFSAPTHLGTPAWLETYVVCLFVFQVALFGVCLLRSISTVSPQAVSKIIVAHFRDGMNASVEQELTAKLTSHYAYQACGASNVRFGGFLATGWPVVASRRGWILDVDAELPGALADLGVGSRITLTADPGEPSDLNRPLARSTMPVRPWLNHVIRKGVRITSRQPAGPPLEVFDDALDVARRSFMDGSDLSHELAVDLLAGCTTAVHDAYRMYGMDY